MSPTVFHEGPFRFFLLSRVEERLHIHVQSAEGEAKLWFDPKIELARNYGLSAQDLRRVERVIEERNRRFGMPGAVTSEAEVTNISQHGFWLLFDGRELFPPFEELPWFKRAPVEAILRLERPCPDHLYWPELDIDLPVDSIDPPERYPLKVKA
jgi:hypothetical protein